MLLQVYKYIDPEDANRHWSEFETANEIIQPGVDVFGFHIMEPVTVITDLFVAVVCFYAWHQIKKEEAKTKPQFYTQIFMLLMGLAATLGAILGHALIHIVPPLFKLPGWYLSMFATAFIERAAIEQASNTMPKKVIDFFLKLNIAELIILCIIVLVTFNFKYVEFHSAYGFLIVVLFFHSYNYKKTKNKGSSMMMLNTILLLVAVFIFNWPVVLHTFFNHRDLAHIVMAISIYVITRASLVEADSV